ncbi:MAG: ATP-binding protein [Rhodoferax sp.]
MKLRVERLHAHTLATEFPELAALTDQLRFGAHAEIGLQQLSPVVLERLGQLWDNGGANQSRRAAQLDSLRHVLHDHPGERFTVETLEKVVPAFVSYIAADARCGWLFSADTDSQPLAWCPTRIDYIPASNDETGKVLIELKANAKAGVIMQTLRLTGGDVKGRSVAEMLLSRGLVRESAALMTAYEMTVERYFDWRAQSGAQFEGRGTAFHAQDPSATHRDADWMRKDVVILSAQGGAARLVNDEGVLQQRNPSLETPGEVLSNYLSKAAKSNHYDAEDEVLALHAELQQRPGLFKRLPVHPLILMFHLDLHHHVWVHVNDLEPYAYQPQLKHKLVLPPEQTDLIDILTAEMDVLMDDIIAGKSGGTTVLCAGPPGVGKTLTAEVYAEIIRRPLYRVHSGQLGLNVATMEASLKEILLRAQRWGAVLLIDEADVYIKRRDDNLTMNAVVGVFLRVLEYFNGLLFLTTNRIDDIDEAIVSRCIALIRYHPPDAAGRRRIWQVMGEQFALGLDESMLDKLPALFPAATGRDIKGLAKLVAKYCHHKQEKPTREVFLRCAMFRGLDAVGAHGA